MRENEASTRKREDGKGEAPLCYCSFFLGQYSLSQVLPMPGSDCSIQSIQWNFSFGTDLYPRDTKNVHIIFVFVISFEGTPLFRGKGYFFKVPTPRFNLHSGDTLALKKLLTTGHNGVTVFKI